jgi:hypothetical protein
VLGIVLAATDHPLGADTLLLHGFPPTSAVLNLTITTPNITISGDCGVNFATDAVLCDIPTSGVDLALRWVDGHIYLHSQSLSGKWIRLNAPAVNLYGLSLEMVKPDIALLDASQRDVVTHVGWRTTHTYRIANSSVATSTSGPVTLTITTGSEGQVEDASLSGVSNGISTVIVATVKSYNQPVVIHAPPRRDTRAATPQEIAALLKLLPGSSTLPLNLTGAGIGV